MTKKMLTAAALAFLGFSAARAGTITYTLQVDDGGIGKWSLYTDVVGGGGIAALNVTMNNATLLTKSYLAPKITYYDSTGTLPDMNAGITFLRAASTSGADWVLVGSQDIHGISQTPPTSTIIYGLGQTAGNLAAALPPGYDGTSGVTQASYGAHLKLASGTYNTALPHASVANWFNQIGSHSTNDANLFNTTGSTVNTIVYATLAVAGISNQTSISSTTAATPDVTLTVTQTGPGGYVPTVASVNGGAGLNKGTANILGPITEAPIWVMARITGADAADVIAALPNQTATADERADLHAKYDKLFPDGGFNALFKFSNPSSAGSFSWDMSGWRAQITALAAVPEPASLGLVALGAVGLLARRRGVRR